jgi:hypothetical protein
MAAHSSAHLLHRSGLAWPRRAFVWLAVGALATTGVIGASIGSSASVATPVEDVALGGCPIPGTGAPAPADTLFQLDLDPIDEVTDGSLTRVIARLTVTNSAGPVTGLTGCDFTFRVSNISTQARTWEAVVAGPLETSPGVYQYTVKVRDEGTYVVHAGYPLSQAELEASFQVGGKVTDCLVDPDRMWTADYILELDVEPVNESVIVWGGDTVDPATVIVRATLFNGGGPIRGATECGLTLTVSTASRWANGAVDVISGPVEESPGVYAYELAFYEGGTYDVYGLYELGWAGGRASLTVPMYVGDCWDTHTVSPTRATVSGPEAATVTVTHSMVAGRCEADNSLTEADFQAELPDGVDIAPGTFVALGNGQYEHKVYALDPGQYGIYGDQVTFTPANAFTQFIEIIRSIIARLMEMITRLLTLWS